MTGRHEHFGLIEQRLRDRSIRRLRLPVLQHSQIETANKTRFCGLMFMVVQRSSKTL